MKTIFACIFLAAAALPAARAVHAGEADILAACESSREFAALLKDRERFARLSKMSAEEAEPLIDRLIENLADPADQEERLRWFVAVGKLITDAEEFYGKGGWRNRYRWGYELDPKLLGGFMADWESTTSAMRIEMARTLGECYVRRLKELPRIEKAAGGLVKALYSDDPELRTSACKAIHSIGRETSWYGWEDGRKFPWNDTVFASVFLDPRPDDLCARLIAIDTETGGSESAVWLLTTLACDGAFEYLEGRVVSGPVNTRYVTLLESMRKIDPKRYEQFLRDAAMAICEQIARAEACGEELGYSDWERKPAVKTVFLELHKYAPQELGRAVAALASNPDTPDHFINHCARWSDTPVLRSLADVALHADDDRGLTEPAYIVALLCTNSSKATNANRYFEERLRRSPGGPLRLSPLSPRSCSKWASTAMPTPFPCCSSWAVL